MEPKTPQSPMQPTRKKTPMYLIALVITMSVIAILLALKLYTDTRSHREDMQYVQGEKTKLEGELKDLIVEYDSSYNFV